MQTKVRAVNQAGAEVDLKATEGGILVTADIKMLWTAKGYGWSAMATTAVAALVVRPTVTAMNSLYNNTSEYFVIDRVFAHNLVAAAVTTSVLWVCVHPVGAVAFDTPTNDITVRNSLSGKQAGSANGFMDVAATVVDDGWFPWGKDAYVLTTTTPGGLLMAEIGGRIIIPPTAAISMSVVASVNTATFCGGFTWYQVPASELDVA